MSSDSVGWLVQDLEEENASLQEELKSLTDERDILEREVDRQRRLLKNCVEEVFMLKDELSHLLETHCPPAETQRQQRLCERLAKHVTEIEREVVEKGAKVEAWRAEREKREEALQQLETSLDRQTQESKRLSKELEQALLNSEKQAHEYLHKISELEELVDSITKQKAESDAIHSKQMDDLKKSVGDAEKAVKAASSSQHQLAQLRPQLSELRRRLGDQEVQLTEQSRTLAERTTQLVEARRAIDVKSTQVTSLKSAMLEMKGRLSQMQKDLSQKAKEEEAQSKVMARKEAIIQRQKMKLEEVAKDLNKLKAVFTEHDIPGLCECNEGALGGAAQELRVLRSGKTLPPCPAKNYRSHAEMLKKQLAASMARTEQLEKNLEEISLKLPQMTAEADRAYQELQNRLKESQAAHQRAEQNYQEQLKRSQQLTLKLAASARKVKDSEQITNRLRQENRSLVTSRIDWERTSGKLQQSLQETVQLTAKLQAVRAELDSERKVTIQLRQRLDSTDKQMKSQLDSVVRELNKIKQTSPGPAVDWPHKYELLLDKCQQWQEECLARQKECTAMEQRLVEVGAHAQPHQPDKIGEGPASSAEEEQLSRMEAQLQTLLRVVGRVTGTTAAVRVRSVPEMVASWIDETSSVTISADQQRLRERSGSSSRDSGEQRSRSQQQPPRRSKSPQTAEPRVPTSSRGRPTSSVPRTSSTKPRATSNPASTSSVTVPVAMNTQRSGVTDVPELAPLLTRAAETVHQLTEQRNQLSAQRRTLEEYRRRDAQEVQALPVVVEIEHPVSDHQETPCRDTGPRETGDRNHASPRAGATSLGRTTAEQLERLTECRALQQLLSKMASPTNSLQSGEVDVPDLTELRAQWRRLETMVRDEAESARTRSDVILRLSGFSESSPSQHTVT